MSADESMYKACDACELLAFDAPPCSECFKKDRSSALCEAHRHECAECYEAMCADHSRVVMIDGESQLVCVDCRDRLENEEQGRSERAFERSLNADNGPSDARYRAEMIDAGRGHLLS